MLLRIIIKNFLSFDDEVQFDMFPNPKRTTLPEHVYSEKRDIPLLKQAAIFGPNASGKSNLVKALEFVRSFVTLKSFLTNIELEKFFYNLKKDAKKDPISIAIEFEHNKKTFLYEIEIGLKCVEYEALIETFPLKSTSDIVFERRNKSVTVGNGHKADNAVAEATKKLIAKNPMSSLLSLNREFPIIPDSRCDIAYKWFRDKLNVIGVHSFIPSLIDILHSNKTMFEFARQLIFSLEVGIKDFTLKDEDFDSWVKQHLKLAGHLPKDMNDIEHLSLNANNTPVWSFSIENGIRKVYRLVFENLGKNGYVGHLDSSSQSDGTLRVLTLLPALYLAIKDSATVVVDELNYCLSSTMVKGIVAFFAESTSNGQLIFTTHDNLLLAEKDYLRSDEVWFVDKKDGSSKMYSHNDFREHHTMSIYKGYIEGRFGAIRFINLLRKDAQ